MYSDYPVEWRLAKEKTKRLYAGKEVWAFLSENESEPRKLLVDRDGSFQYWFEAPANNLVCAYWENLHPEVNRFPYVDTSEPDEDWAFYAYATKENALSARATEIARRKLRDEQEIYE